MRGIRLQLLLLQPLLVKIEFERYRRLAGNSKIMVSLKRADSGSCLGVRYTVARSGVIAQVPEHLLHSGHDGLLLRVGGNCTRLWRSSPPGAEFLELLLWAARVPD